MPEFKSAEILKIYEHVRSIPKALIFLEDDDFLEADDRVSYTAMVQQPKEKSSELALEAIEKAMAGRSKDKIRYAVAAIYGKAGDVSMQLVNSVIEQLQGELPKETEMIFGLQALDDNNGNIGLDLILAEGKK